HTSSPSAAATRPPCTSSAAPADFGHRHGQRQALRAAPIPAAGGRRPARRPNRAPRPQRPLAPAHDGRHRQHRRPFASARAPPASVAEYAGVSRGMWVAAHLLQLGGVACLVLVVVLLARVVNGTRGSAWARVATVLGTAALATAAVLQAVDGVALKAVVDLWS